MNLGIQPRLILLAVFPLLLVTLLMGYSMAKSQILDLDQSIDRQGISLLGQLVRFSEFSLFSGDHPQLEILAERTLIFPDVARVQFKDSNGILLVDQNRGGLNNTSKNLYYQGFVYSSPIAISDDIDEVSDSSRILLGEVLLEMSTESIQIKQDGIISRTLLIMSFGLLISIGFAIWIAASFARPLISLTRTVTKMQGGDLTARAPELATGEVGLLVKGFNAMGETIEKNQIALENQVSEATKKLKRTVKELVSKNTLLDDAKKNAELMAEEKALFLARMSHDIRTPLNAVVGFSQNLTESSTTEERRESIDIIATAANQLNQLVDDILVLTHLESEGAKLNHLRFNLRECIESTLLMLSNPANDKGLELVLLFDENVFDWGTGDELRVSQIINNLVNNAIKFTDAGHILIKVSLSSGNTHKGIVIAVEDTGPGISETNSKELFEPFKQLDNLTTRKQGGTGLGLSISKRLAVAMGGELSLVKKHTTSGAIFELYLPWKTSDTLEKNCYIFTSKNILVWEENPWARRSMRNLLLASEANVYTPNQISDFNDLLHNANPELLIISVPASHQESTSIKNYLNIISINKIIPILVLTGTKKLFINTQENWKYEHLQKPYTQSRLLERTYFNLYKNTANENITEPWKKGRQSDNLLLGCKFLIAEDNTFNQQLLKGWLTAQSAQVDLVDNGVDAIKSARKELYSIIFMDVHMPQMGGIEAAKEIKLHNSNAIIIALTADVIQQLSTSENAVLFNAVLYKPLNKSKLLDKIVSLLQSNSPTPIQNQNVSQLNKEELHKLKQSLAALIAQSNISFDNQDWRLAKDLAHQIAGLAGYFEIDQLTKNVASYRHALKNKHLEEAKHLLLSITHFEVT